MDFAISVPVGAWHPLLPQCLASLASQEAKISVALFDASGDDRVRQLADDFDDTITFRHHGPDNGQADAILKGWNAVDGEILGWLNADDILFPDTLERVERRIRNEGLGVVYGHSTIIDLELAVTGWQYGVERKSPRLGHASVISQPSCFFLRSAHDQIGGIDPTLHYTMDWDLFVRLYHSGVDFGFEDDALSMVLWSDDTKTSSLNKRRKAEIKRMLASFPSDTPQWKSFLGFRIQHLIDHAPPALRRKMLALFFSDERSINGLSADGGLAEKVTLPFCHYRAAHVQQLSLEFDSRCGDFRAFCEGEELSIVASRPSQFLLASEKPFLCGTRKMIELHFSGAEKARIIRMKPLFSSN